MKRTGGVASNLDLAEVSGEELAHGEGAHPLGSEDLGHLLVGSEELLVLGVLKHRIRTNNQIIGSHKA